MRDTNTKNAPGAAGTAHEGNDQINTQEEEMTDINATNKPDFTELHRVNATGIRADEDRRKREKEQATQALAGIRALLDNPAAETVDDSRTIHDAAREYHVRQSALLDNPDEWERAVDTDGAAADWITAAIPSVTASPHLVSIHDDGRVTVWCGEHADPDLSLSELRDFIAELTVIYAWGTAQAGVTA